MRPIQLSPRLRSVGELVPPGCLYADVGTDHAYLPVWLLQKGTIDRAIVSDVREGPLKRAMETAERYELTERLSFRLCDGLAGFQPEEVDTVSIAGMGGETIAAILSAAPWTGTGARRWILQPMTAVEELRGWLVTHGFQIADEVLTQEGRTLYVTLLVCPGEAGYYTPAELWVGRQPQDRGDPLRSTYLDKTLRRVTGALEGARRSGKTEDQARARMLDEVYHGLTAMREEWEKWQR